MPWNSYENTNNCVCQICKLNKTDQHCIPIKPSCRSPGYKNWWRNTYVLLISFPFLPAWYRNNTVKRHSCSCRYHLLLARRRGMRWGDERRGEKAFICFSSNSICALRRGKRRASIPDLYFFPCRNVGEVRDTDPEVGSLS